MRFGLKHSFVGVSLLALSVPAYGQDAKPADETTAESDDVITVTARRREESLRGSSM